MLELKDFKRYMDNIVKIVEFEDKYNDLCREMNFECCEIRFPSLIDDCVALLTTIMNDRECEWISYWVFELDCGKKYEPGTVKEADGSVIPLATIEDLYQLLISK